MCHCAHLFVLVRIDHRSALKLKQHQSIATTSSAGFGCAFGQAFCRFQIFVFRELRTEVQRFAPLAAHTSERLAGVLAPLLLPQLYLRWAGKVFEVAGVKLS